MPHGRMPILLPLSVLAATSVALMYDVVENTKLPPVECGVDGCLTWADVSNGTRFWRDPGKMQSAGASCAQPGLAVNEHPYGVSNEIGLLLRSMPGNLVINFDPSSEQLATLTHLLLGCERSIEHGSICAELTVANPCISYIGMVHLRR